MNWSTIKPFAVKAAPVILGMILGVSGTKAVTSYQEAKTACPDVKVTCILPPIKGELVFKK